jgi:putative protease
MAITCPRCGAGFDVTLFQFGHRVRCQCGQWVELSQGHLRVESGPRKEGSEMAEIEIGKISHYFSKIGVAAIEITSDQLNVGDTVHIKGHTSDFRQKIDSMQVDNKSVSTAEPGDSVGIKVAEHTRQHDVVYRVVE